MEKAIALISIKKYLILLIVIVATITACKKKADGIEGIWKVTGATANPAVTYNGVSTTDVYDYIFPNQCSKDNLFIFNDNGTLIFDEGAIKCDTTDAQQTNATYSIANGYITIIDSDTAVYSGFSVDEDNMQFSIPNSSVAGTTTTIALKFSRQ